ncbi:MAG TPA: family 10 glycosylhydrolase [Armatimonadota bacterium]|jgi:uncharacterized lipoprotein YddW (UPF0748 family)
MRQVLAAALLLMLAVGARGDTEIALPPKAPLTSAVRPYVLVIRGTSLGAPEAQWMAGIANDAFEAVRAALTRAGLAFRETTDGEVDQGLEDLRAPRAIVLPYNRALSPAEVKQLLAALDKGVPLVAFHVAGAQIETRLGVKTTDFTPIDSSTQVALHTDVVNLPGAPASLTLTPHFQRSFTMLPDQAITVGWWGPTGQVEAQRAITLSEAGAFLGFVPRAEDAPALAGLLWALLGRLSPGVVSGALPHNVRELGPIGTYASLGDMMNAWRAPDATIDAEAWRLAKQAEALVWGLNDLVNQGQLGLAMDQAQQARAVALQAYQKTSPGPPPEIRGVWAMPQASPDWETAATQLQAGHFNVIFPFVASAGVAWYPSQILPRTTETKRDCLADAAAAAGKHGLQLHPRLLALSTLYADAATKRALAAAGRLMLDSQGHTSDWLCPTDPRNQEQLLAVATEIVMRYQPPGLQLDYFRYDATDTCVCARCRAQFEQEMGVKAAQWPQDVTTGALRGSFLQWRAGVLTKLLRALRTQLKAVRPEVQLSVCVFPDWVNNPDEIGQRPAQWAREGLVDFICPMNYSDDLVKYKAWTAEEIRLLQGSVPLAVGIGAFSDACRLNSPQDMYEQVEAARQAGAGGFVVFNYCDRFVRDFVPWLTEHLGPTPPLPWK